MSLECLMACHGIQHCVDTTVLARTFRLTSWADSARSLLPAGSSPLIHIQSFGLNKRSQREDKGLVSEDKSGTAAAVSRQWMVEEVELDEPKYGEVVEMAAACSPTPKPTCMVTVAG
jgi:hypothetical protein